MNMENRYAPQNIYEQMRILSPGTSNKQFATLRVLKF